MPSHTAATIYLFGVTAFTAGVYTLLLPNENLRSLDLPSACLPSAYGNGLAAIAMGIYYILAAYQENRAFFMLTIPMRSLTATLFWCQGGPWRIAALWEVGGALLTAMAMGVTWFQRRKGDDTEKRA